MTVAQLKLAIDSFIATYPSLKDKEVIADDFAISKDEINGFKRITKVERVGDNEALCILIEE